MAFSIFLILVVILLLLIFTTIRIDVKNLEVSNYEKIKLEYDYLVYIKLYIFNYIKYFQIKIDKEKVDKSNLVKKINIQKANKQFENIKISTKNLKPEVEKIDMNVKVGTESMFMTTFLVLVISVGISYLLKNTIKKANPEKHKYKIEPSYINKNLIDLKLNCIIKVKMVHIISVIYIVLKKRRGLKNERTSNRRLNDDSHEQYSRYGRCKHNYRGTN